ncbi:rRNA maturation RNase YbeY [Paracoccus sp. 1_MG-2023]|uniref:rRNA maturation RNase YbeY n=1 Tax=unclassified Paracoccus (in: a-proteobacteria) TaxID=2688777 RepID=UPI001C07F41C|nr:MULTISPECIES: rRNA maturation RNase YbeY [unclassified Paracoccus (in: a-proteobacteria)]MBU2956732.1 rRNA maturation RNase YbeY [Paracoccus sp. C2R09]MDO6669228.1 rRNA maturation RNase YbeY [Paracoccus sp. 1_MG-2023]
MPDQITADCVIEDERWEAAGLEALAARAIAAALEWHGIGGEVVVMGCDDARIAALNADFRGKPRATNVLSWPSVEHVEHAPGEMPDLPDEDELGDIAIAFETCEAEAKAQGKPFDHHVQHLLIHATLHLLGYDHENDPDAERMEEAERRILTVLDIPDPYRENLP